MLKLRELQKKERQRESITVYRFNVSNNEWIQFGEVQFEITKQHFGEKGFRRAFKASSDNEVS